MSHFFTQRAERPHRRRHGFTLVEVLCALTVLSLILVALNSAWTATLRGISRVRAEGQCQRKVTGLADLLSSDFAGIRRIKEEPVPSLWGVRDAAFNDRVSGRLEFFTTHSFSSLESASRGGTKRVRYVVEPGEESDERFRIYREEWGYSRLDPTQRADPAPHLKQRVLLADDLAAWRVRYADTKGWFASWKRAGTLPLLVEIRYRFQRPDGSLTREMRLAFAPEASR